MLSTVKVLDITGDSYSVELSDSDLGIKKVCFHMPEFDQAAFDRIVLHLHQEWTKKGNGAPVKVVPEIDIYRILHSMDKPVEVKIVPADFKPLDSVEIDTQPEVIDE